jgi:carnitine O-acetyltransferase
LEEITSKRMFATSSRRPEQAKTYALQQTLPRLPVPDLEKSLKAYLKSLVPVLEQKVGYQSVISRGSRSSPAV